MPDYARPEENSGSDNGQADSLKASLGRLNRAPHRRYNPLADEWVLVSPHRTQRPWQGQVEDRPPEDRPTHDPGCYLCPGNTRAGGIKNPDYTETFVYDNDFAALLPDIPAGPNGKPEAIDEGSLIVARSERGLCRVICYSPRHDLSLAEMPMASLRKVVDLWANQTTEVGSLPYIGHVQIFENRTQMMGASSPHPHGQLWANETLPELPARELAAQRRYHSGEGGKEKGRCLLCDYLALELSSGERLVCQNDEFVALVPFWATWPFETIVLPRRHVASLPELEPGQRDALGDILKRLAARYDNMFKAPFPYSMGFHQAPTDGPINSLGKAHPEWHLHSHFFPPLLRSATVRKFLVGYEMLATVQRDLTPESAAERLRALSETHYRENGNTPRGV